MPSDFCEREFFVAWRWRSRVGQGSCKNGVWPCLTCPSPSSPASGFAGDLKKKNPKPNIKLLLSNVKSRLWKCSSCVTTHIHVLPAQKSCWWPVCGHRKGIFKNLLGWLCETNTFMAKMGGFGCKAALMCILWTDTLLRSFPEEQAA